MLDRVKMPNYEVEHICPLTESQKDEIAEAITQIHTKQFTAPRLFVNCRFTNIKDHAVYVAGKRVGFLSHLIDSCLFLFLPPRTIHWPRCTAWNYAAQITDDILTRSREQATVSSLPFVTAQAEHRPTSRMSVKKSSRPGTGSCLCP